MRLLRFLVSLARDLPVWFFLLIVAAIELLPIMWTFATSMRPFGGSFKLPPDFFPTVWNFENYWAVLTSKLVPLPLFVFNSLKVSVITTLGQLITCSMAAYAFARLRFWGRDFIFFLFLASMMIPGTVTIIPLYIIISKAGWMNSHTALIAPAITSAFGVFLLRQFFMTLPSELVDAAKIDGAGFFRIFWSVMLPLVGPGLSSLAVFTFLGSWNSFYSPLLFLQSRDKYTLPLGLVTMGSGRAELKNPAYLLAGIVISIVPVLVIFLLAQRYVIRGIALTGIKG
jgi:multiple sugar transport system permease protein